MIEGVDVERSPEQIESQIAETRASLDRTLREIERRLSPSAQVQRLKARVNADAYLAWGAVGAIATGALLAVRGWRRQRLNGDFVEKDLISDEMPFE
jgi:hypothetical protein